MDNRTCYEHGCEYGSDMDAFNRTYQEHGCYSGFGMNAFNQTYSTCCGLAMNAAEFTSRMVAAAFLSLNSFQVLFVPHRPVSMLQRLF